MVLVKLCPSCIHAYNSKVASVSTIIDLLCIENCWLKNSTATLVIMLANSSKQLGTRIPSYDFARVFMRMFFWHLATLLLVDVPTKPFSMYMNLHEHRRLNM